MIIKIVDGESLCGILQSFNVLVFIAIYYIKQSEKKLYKFFQAL